MPILKIFSDRPLRASSEPLAAALERLCIQALAASADAIQIVLIEVAAMPRGEPVLVEAHFRAQPHRGGPAVERFMDGVEQSVLEHVGVRPRIRCFAVDAAGLGARN